jgi:hypothetical protein
MTDLLSSSRDLSTVKSRGTSNWESKLSQLNMTGQTLWQTLINSEHPAYFKERHSSGYQD